MGTLSLSKAIAAAVFLLFTFSESRVWSQGASSDKQASIVVIDSQGGEPYSTIRSYLYKQLEARHWKVGKNLSVNEFAIGNMPDTVASIWKYEIRNKNVKVVYVSGTMATIGAKKYLLKENIKVVFAAPTDPVAIGVITDFSSAPAYNFTGVCYPVRVHHRLEFLKALLPQAKRIGYIYTEMPQSLSYLSWLQQELKKPEFKGLKLVLGKVPFIPSEGGQIRMAKLAQKYVQNMNDQVDVFLTPNDQMGTQQPFAEMVSQTATKPLIGLGEKDVTEHWGAIASLFPSLEDIGTQSANMIADLLEGRDIKTLPPRWPREGVALNLKKMKQHHLPPPPSELVQRAREDRALVE